MSEREGPERETRFGGARSASGPGRGGGPPDSPEAAYASARGRLEEQIAQEPENGEARLDLGSLASFAGDFETAEIHLRRAVELLPEDARAHLRLGDILYETARLAEAVDHYREAASLAEGSAVGEEARVEWELAERELALVFRPLEEAEANAARAAPQPADLNRLGCLSLAAGRIEQAADAFRRALSCYPGDDLRSLQAALNFGFVQGLATVEPSRLKRSVSELGAAAGRFPEEPRLYLHLAELYEASSLYDAAVARIEKALEVAPGCVEAYDMAARYVMLGGEYEERLGKKIDEIVAAAEKAHRASPKDREAKKALALAYLGRARFRRQSAAPGRATCGREGGDDQELSGAGELFNELLQEIADEDDDALVRLAECRERMGRRDEAERLLEELTRRSPGSGRAAFELAAHRLRTGRPAEAVELFARATRLAPEEATFYQSLRYALAAARKLRTAELLSRAELALAEKPNDPRSAGAHLDLGRAYLDALKTDEAVEVLRRAAELAPDRADVHTGLGRALTRAGRPEEAEKSLKRALELDPNSPEAHRGLGSLLIEQPGRMREGLAELEEYRRLRADHGGE